MRWSSLDEEEGAQGQRRRRRPERRRCAKALPDTPKDTRSFPMLGTACYGWVLDQPNADPGLHRRIAQRVARGHITGKAGFIYVFACDRVPDYWKIGVTTQANLYDRLRRHKNPPLVYMRQVRCAQFVERLVHLVLDPWRLVRYVFPGGTKLTGWHALRGDTGKRFHVTSDPVYAAVLSQEPPEDVPQDVLERVRSNTANRKGSLVPFRPGKRTKEIEWFHLDLRCVVAMCDAVASVINEWADGVALQQQQKE